jgi:hypothetical protein
MSHSGLSSSSSLRRQLSTRSARPAGLTDTPGGTGGAELRAESGAGPLGVPLTLVPALPGPAVCAGAAAAAGGCVGERAGQLPLLPEEEFSRDLRSGV